MVSLACEIVRRVGEGGETLADHTEAEAVLCTRRWTSFWGAVLAVFVQNLARLN